MFEESLRIQSLEFTKQVGQEFVASCVVKMFYAKG